ncbi:molybdopterin oxidoreductase family protein [Salinispira pacifica]
MSDLTIRTTCSYCSVGCNFDAVVSAENGELKSFLPSKSYPVNLGKSCPKGFNLMKAFAAEDRLTRPLARNGAGELEPVSWDQALELFTSRFKEIKERHGPESVAYLSTGQIPMEEMALLGALFKFGMGFVHADGNTRQCMATAAVAYKQAFGFDAPPFSYKDFEESDLMIFVGANPVIAHPVIWNRVKMNSKDADIVVIDPRRTKTAQAASVHLPLRPKSDLSLLYAVARELIARDWIDRDYIDAHTEGFDAFAAHVEQFTLERAENDSGISKEGIVDLVERIHRARAMSIYWTMGVNQSHQAVRTAQAIINLCLITGNIGRPGTGPNSITGQANAMGSRLYSNTTSLFAGYDFTKEADRTRIAEILGIDPKLVPQKNSLPYHRILEAVDTGMIKGLWIIATNPAHSWIDKNDLFRRFEKLEFLVVQDLYGTTETARRADLLLPAAGSGEKQGTLINSERRLGVVQKVADPPGEALADFEIFRRIGAAWGCDEVISEWTDPEAAFRILQRCSAGRPCDITGIEGYQMLRDRGGVQWPYPAAGADDEPERRLFGDGRFFTESGRARLLFDPVTAPGELPDAQYPFVLLTGRGTNVQWHTQTRTGKVEMLRKLYPAQAYVQLHPTDAKSLGISGKARVRVSSRRGSVTVDAEVTEEVQQGQLFMPMHYPETNLLTFPSFDPYSSEPSYKYSAVTVEPE